MHIRSVFLLTDFLFRYMNTADSNLLAKKNNDDLKLSERYGHMHEKGICGFSVADFNPKFPNFYIPTEQNGYNASFCRYIIYTYIFEQNHVK